MQPACTNRNISSGNTTALREAVTPCTLVSHQGLVCVNMKECWGGVRRDYKVLQIRERCTGREEVWVWFSQATIAKAIEGTHRIQTPGSSGVEADSAINSDLWGLRLFFCVRRYVPSWALCQQALWQIWHARLCSCCQETSHVSGQQTQFYWLSSVLQNTPPPISRDHFTALKRTNRSPVSLC